ncbi:VOC family protein [Sporolactobacillus pectinivorans]|uniref:SMU1112c/YaeR family gloxylase I-like metalloprotein n=1 Tax=Sporolactobacillus pectinivorans TaxID=1591408 RepID=UPI000C26A0CE|nr:VOC family protein [Sporolactobacillus pectinivorans]
MLFSGISHCAIICSDYRKSRHFYVDLLGLAVIRETYREERKSFKLDLKVGSSSGQIELFSFPDSPKRLSYPEACGLRHLAFNVADIEFVRDSLNRKGILTEPIRTDTLTGKKFTFFRDPDDLPIELYEA